eukprot:6272056-Pyramimonas_sp.AAC.1
MILKAIQSCVGEFPEIALGSLAERAEQLQEWRHVVGQALEAGGPHVTQRWGWCWQVAQDTHGVHLQAPIMNRETIRVQPRNPVKWQMLETWIKPRL